VLAPYFVGLGVLPNSDFFPVLEMNAPLARFTNSRMPDLAILAGAPLPLLALFDARARQPDPARLSAGERPWLQRSAWVRQADEIRGYLRTGNEKALAGFNVELGSDLMLLRAALVDCKLRLPEAALRHQLADLARFVSIHLPPAAAASFWDDLGRNCAARLSAGDRRWLRLHRAVGAGEGGEMMRAAQPILDAQGLEARYVAYALAASMAGAILTDQTGAAMAAFGKHRGRLTAARDWEPVFRFLVGQADSSMTKSGSR
jgi:hypothetical protein